MYYSIMDRKGKMIRISDEAYEKLKSSDIPMSQQIDNMLGLSEGTPRTFRKTTPEYNRFVLSNFRYCWILISIYELRKLNDGKGAERKDILQYLKDKTDFHETMIEKFGYEIETPQGRKELNDSIDNSLKSISRKKVSTKNDIFRIINKDGSFYGLNKEFTKEIKSEKEEAIQYLVMQKLTSLTP